MQSFLSTRLLVSTLVSWIPGKISPGKKYHLLLLILQRRWLERTTITCSVRKLPIPTLLRSRSYTKVPIHHGNCGVAEAPLLVPGGVSGLPLREAEAEQGFLSCTEPSHLRTCSRKGFSQVSAEARKDKEAPEIQSQVPGA